MNRANVLIFDGNNWGPEVDAEEFAVTLTVHLRNYANACKQNDKQVTSSARGFGTTVEHMERTAKHLMRFNPAWTIDVRREDEPSPLNVAEEALTNGHISSPCQSYARISLSTHGESIHATCIVV